MENQKTMPIALRYGVISALALICFSLVTNILGLSTNQAVGYLAYLVMGVFMFLASKTYKESNESYISFGQSFGISFVITAISSFASSIFFYIYVTMIDSKIIEMIKDQQVEAMEKQGMSEAELEKAMEYASMFLSPGILTVFAFLGMVFFGTIIALIIAAIVKNNRPELT